MQNPVSLWDRGKHHGIYCLELIGFLALTQLKLQARIKMMTQMIEFWGKDDSQSQKCTLRILGNFLFLLELILLMFLHFQTSRCNRPLIPFLELKQSFKLNNQTSAAFVNSLDIA